MVTANPITLNRSVDRSNPLMRSSTFVSCSVVAGWLTGVGFIGWDAEDGAEFAGMPTFLLVVRSPSMEFLNNMASI